LLLASLPHLQNLTNPSK